MELGGWPMGFVSPNSRDFWKMCHWTNFEKYPIYRGFFDFFRHFMHSYEIQSSIFTILGNFSLKYRNFSKFSAPAAPKTCHLTQFCPKIFQNFPFICSFCTEKCVTERQIAPPPFDRWPTPIPSLIIIYIISRKIRGCCEFRKFETSANSKIRDYYEYG